jgi:murein DD-endopeptidase MepM/ murein hydrolase activator NlpD
MSTKFCWILIFFGLINSSVFAQDRPVFPSKDINYLWPTNASDYMSATFGETRSAHFHAAIDIGTWGREGYDVYAARDGLLYRIGVSPYGYGNVIYLQHEDETFTVYAHLQDFNPQIRAVVDSVRFQNYAHSFDRVLSEKGIFF